MATAATVEPALDAVERARARRADRLDARQVLWRESSLERLRDCGRRIVAGNTAGVAVRVHPGQDGGCGAGFGGLESCGSPWACPWCASKIASERARQVQQIAAEHQRQGGDLAFVTLTMRHRDGQRLEQLWDGLTKAWNAATSGRGWKDDQARCGVHIDRVIQSGARKGDVVREPRIPVVRVVEVTHGANGWHVHVHALLLLPRCYGAGPADDKRMQLARARYLGERTFDRWRASLVRQGFDAPLPRHGGLEAHPVYGDARSFGEYLTKGQYDGPRSVALEMTRGDLKRARGGNRTPFSILRSVYETGDVADLALWHAWEQGSKGRRQVAGIPAAQRYLGLDDTEVTDQEAAEADAGGETLCYITPDGWYGVVCRTRGLQARILSAAVEGTVLQLLESLAVGYRLSGDEGPPLGGPPGRAR